MKRKTLIAAIITALIGVVCMAGLLAAADVPDEVIIKDPGYSKYKKGPVKLTHKKHTDEYGVKCVDCHHVYEDGKNVWKEGDPIKKCSECHPEKKSEGKLYKMKAGTAYHKNCKDCHKEAKKGPYKKCNDCHGEKE